ncbi:hypothetical protein F0562_006283 [Nyssa sinensis]|uniref:Uncharacterized protein n=1 Tax=Nyssa sinensis TaxID=561372 RepID=A0A5J5AMP6_9ASTE|nr:hypothetical protein F0562_006283 [Nyssa sinensis]
MQESVFAKQKRISNTVKMLTAVLKFVVDATMFKEEDLKDIFLCLKSSFTYAAKLLNLVLTSSTEALPPPLEAYDLANDMLDLVISTELYLGSSYAAHLVAAVKPWLPDLILALGSKNIMKPTLEERMWPSVLAKIELRELTEVGLDEEGDRVSEPAEFSAFKKLVEMMVLLLRGNINVLDAIGVIFLTYSVVELERKEFELVLGLLHFVCVKLVRREHVEWGELKLMLATLQDIYPQIEREAEELCSNEHAWQKLESARAMLEPVWMYYIYETGRDPTTEE